MKRVRLKPISYFGMALLAFGAFGEDILGITDKYLGYGFIVLCIIGIVLMIKGKEIYESN